LILGLAAVALAAVPVAYFAMRAKPIDSLAVMPFVNVGADPNTEYLSDGITENLINNLSQLSKLRVVPRTLVSAYKSKEMDPGKAGRDLHVRAILTGKVVQRGDSLNIQTELMDVGELSQLWGQRYDRKFSEILAVQEDIAKQVSERLHLRPTGAEQKQLARRYTENTEAYQLYLKGRYYWNRRTPELLKKANEYFQQTIEKDPSYGLAYAGLAQSYGLFPYYGVQSPSESCPKTEAAAKRALAIDESLAEVHVALMWSKMSCDWDWPGSEREFRRALEINPNDATAKNWHGIYLWAMGRLEEAVTESKQALEADPLSLIVGAAVGRALHYAGHDDQAIEQLRKTIDMDPSLGRAGKKPGQTICFRLCF
jgi:TolB-like protein/Tfp pilus assembly protein PilF